MNKQVIEYYGHEFIRVLYYIGWIWECKKCKYQSRFIIYIKDEGSKILSCNERLIKNIIE